MRQEFTSAYRRIYPKHLGDRGAQVSHAAALAAGLTAIGPGFNAEICAGCHGKGCPTWSATSYEVCRCCNGIGLVQGGTEAPPSVVNQVLVAAGTSRDYPQG